MPVNTFEALSILAIVAGGLISAFSARRPTRAMAWVSAYLVLVVGVIQLGLVTSWHQLGGPSMRMALVALLVFDIGNAAVIAGTLLKRRIAYYPVLVNAGGACIALAMVLLLVAVRTAQTSWMYAAFIALVVVTLVSMPIGLVLSSRRRAGSQ